MSNPILEAEKNVLASIVQNPELLVDCPLGAAQFIAPQHQNLMKTLLDMQDKEIPIDLNTIGQRLHSKQENLDRVGGVGYLTELAMHFSQVSSFEYFVEGVLEEYKKRETAQLGLQLTHGMDPEVAQTEFQKLQDIGKVAASKSIKEGLVEMYDAIESATGEISGVRSGFSDLDRMTQGYQKEDLIIVAARPSVGKTAFALNIARNAALSPNNLDGAGVGIFSLETPTRNLLRRMTGAVGNIDLHVLRQGRPAMADSDWRKLTMSMGELSGCEIFIDDEAGVDLAYIFRAARKMKKEFDEKNPDKDFIIIIDYLQLIIGNPKFGGNRMQEISDISRGLKRLARQLKCPVIALSQLSRNVEQRQDKRPMMSDLRESGQIEQDADVIQFLYREDYYDKETENQNLIEIITAKQREGSTGTTTLAFIKEFGKFVTLDFSSGSNQSSGDKNYQ